MEESGQVQAPALSFLIFLVRKYWCRHI